MKQGLRSAIPKQIIRAIVMALSSDGVGAESLSMDAEKSVIQRGITYFLFLIMVLFVIMGLICAVSSFTRLNIKAKGKVNMALVSSVVFVMTYMIPLAEAVKYTITIEVNSNGTTQTKDGPPTNAAVASATVSSSSTGPQGVQGVVLPETEVTGSAGSAACVSSAQQYKEDKWIDVAVENDSSASASASASTMPSGEMSHEARSTERGQEQVYRIGLGNCYRRAECGMVQRCYRVEPHKLQKVTKRTAKNAGLKSCKQCRPE